MCDFIYEFGDDGVSLLKYIGKDKNVVIPPTIEGENVYYITQDCFNNNENIESVFIPYTVVVIHPGAFSNCINLKKVNLPNYLAYLGRGCFFNCVNLEEIEIPRSLQSLAGFIFYNCKSLKSVKFKGTLNYIGPSCFDRCKLLKELIIKGDKLEIETYAFYGCENLEKVVLTGLSVSDKYIFKNCKNLKRIVMKCKELLYITSNIFEGCDSLKTIYFFDKDYEETGYSELCDLDIVNEDNSKCKLVNLADREYIKSMIKSKLI